jgi:hypothetical protein
VGRFAKHQWLTPAILATWEAEIEWISFRGQSKEIKFKRLYLQYNQRTMDWRCGSRGRVPAMQVQHPELKPRFY